MPKPRHGSGRAGRWLALAASTSYGATCTGTAVVSAGGSLPTAYQDDGAVLRYDMTIQVICGRSGLTGTETWNAGPYDPNDPQPGTAGDRLSWPLPSEATGR